MISKNKWIGYTVIGGASGFLIIVGFLHLVQTGYDPVRQPMSELVFGEHGSFLLPAFSCFAISVFSVQTSLAGYRSSLVIRGLLCFSSFSLFGAGIFHLGNAPDVHIFLVALSFVFLVLAMYLLPRNVPAFSPPGRKAVSWFLGFATAVWAASGENLVPMGVSQRGAAICIFTWLMWFGSIQIRSRRPQKALRR